ncbi:MAG: choice-of-anchor A family protein [Aestuariibacter sp.]|nr:choice-of-anchor A family protein [Aestuariibacter sp.]MCP4529018.1 choice-of-anchor A family protein [Aestuariibacter sp.]
MKRFNQLIASLAVVVSMSAVASVENVGTYNLILKNDLDTSSDIEGRLLVGGNVNMAGKSLKVGSLLGADPTVDAVTIVGDIKANDVQALNGNIVYGGNKYSTNLIVNSGNTATAVSQGLLQAEFNSVYQSVIDDSNYYKTLAANGTFNTSDMNNLKFESNSSDDLLVFNINGTDLLNGSFSFGFTPTVPIIINVAGTGALNINSKALGNFSKEVASLVLWNFFDYTSIGFNGDGWNGSVLAPNADITSGTGSLDGGFAALSYTGTVELHNQLFTYEPPGETPGVDVPAPPVFFLLFGGLIATMALRRRS